MSPTNRSRRSRGNAKGGGGGNSGGGGKANAGNSGGNEESGLYFELRYQGRAFDPATWVKF